METFSALLALCAGNSPVTGEFPSQKPVMRYFGVFFDLRLNRRLSKQSRGWWFETPSQPLWRDCNEFLPNDRHLEKMSTPALAMQYGRISHIWKELLWTDNYVYHRTRALPNYQLLVIHAIYSSILFMCIPAGLRQSCDRVVLSNPEGLG